jgi:hypothetical protein
VDSQKLVDGLVKVILQFDRIQQRPLTCKRGSLPLRQGRFQESLTGCFQDFVIDLEDFRADPGLVQKFLVGNEEVDQRAEEGVDAIEGVKFFPGIAAPAAGIVSDEGVILFVRRNNYRRLRERPGGLTVSRQMRVSWLMNSEPLSRWNSIILKGLA